MEADLARYYHVDYRDRWAPGPRRLTLRRLAVLLRHLPADSTVANLDRDVPPWTLVEHLLDDIRRTVALTGGAKNPKPYPGRFTPVTAKPMTPARARHIAGARRRAAERRRRIAAGEIT